MTKTSKEKIAEWKRKYGEVFEVSVGNKKCFLKPPTRQILSAALTYEKTDPLKSDEILLNSCWIEGDEEIKTDLNLFLSVRESLSGLFEFHKAKLVKH